MSNAASPVPSPNGQLRMSYRSPQTPPRFLHGATAFGDESDSAADADDVLADARDDAASTRDRQARARECASAGAVDPDAEAARVAAARDRQAAARDRRRAASDRDSARAELERSAVYEQMWRIDATTGVLRREAGTLELDRLLSTCDRHHRRMVVVFVDVDGLKKINDSRGHAAGDEVLRTVADALMRYSADDDVVVRHGGDEFLLGAVGVGVAGMERTMAALRHELQTWRATSVTTGIAESIDGEPMSRLIERADADLYRRRNATS